MNASNKKILLVVLFVVFLFLRLFVNLPSILLAGDSLKFLSLAMHFPYHTLSNNQLYLQHPPIYPYMMHFLNLFLKEDYLAAIAVNLISACITFFIIYKFFMLLTDRFDVTFVSLLLFTLSEDFIIASHKVTRESFVVMLIILSLYFYIKGIRLSDKKSIIAASIFGAISGVTTDHVILLFPALALSYLFLNHKKISFRNLNFPNLKYAVIPVLITLLFYGSWLMIKAHQYSINEHYPAGMEGTPLKIKNLGLFELINPTFFEDYDTNVGVDTPDFLSTLKKYAFNLGYMINMEPFSIPRGLNLTTMKFLLFPKHVFYMIIIYLPLALIALYGVLLILKNFIKTRKMHNNINLFIIFLFLIFVFPITQKVVSPRYLYPAYIFLYYIIAYSIITLLRKILLFKKNAKIFTIVFVILILLLIPTWYYNNNYFVFSLKKTIKSQNAGDFINNNLKKTDAIMSQPGYTYRLIYLTRSRMVSMPPKPADLLFFIERYNISYVVFGRFFTLDKYHYSADSVQFIKDNPDKFKFIAAIKEDYAIFYNPKDKARTDEEYIYEVVK